MLVGLVRGITSQSAPIPLQFEILVLALLILDIEVPYAYLSSVILTIPHTLFGCFQN